MSVLSVRRARLQTRKCDSTKEEAARKQGARIRCDAICGFHFDRTTDVVGMPHVAGSQRKQEQPIRDPNERHSH